MDACVFCRVSLKNGEEITQLREKGCNTVNRTSQTRNDTIVTTPGQKVHQKCRREYINANSIKKDMREKDVSITEPTRDLRFLLLILSSRRTVYLVDILQNFQRAKGESTCFLSGQQIVLTPLETSAKKEMMNGPKSF